MQKLTPNLSGIPYLPWLLTGMLCLISFAPGWSAVLIEQDMTNPARGGILDPLEESRDLFNLGLSLTPDRVSQDSRQGGLPRELLDSLKMEYASKNFDKALKLLDLAIRQLPDNLDLLLVKMGILLDLKRWDQAKDAAQEVLKIDNRSIKAYTTLGYASLQQNNKEQAAKYYEKLALLFPYDGRAHVRVGLIHFSLGNFSDAERAFSEAIERQPEYAEAHDYLGVLRYRQEQFPEAILLHQAALKLDPNLAEAQNHLGSALFQAGKREEAIAAYQEAIKLKPSYADAMTNLGASLAAEGKAVEALAALLQSLEWKIDQPLGWSNLLLAMDKFVATPPPESELAEAAKLDAAGHYKQALALTEKKEFKQAVYHFVRAIEGEINNADYHNDFGVVLAAGGQPALGYIFIKAALFLKPDNQGALNNLQQLMVADQQQKLQQAYNQLVIRTQEQPDDAAAQAQLAMMLANAGNITNALERISIAVEHASTNVSYRVQRARLLFLNGRVEDALKEITPLKEADPQNAWLQHQFAWLVLKQEHPSPEQLKQAIPAARLAVKADGNNYEYLQTLAQVYEASGDTNSTLKIIHHTLKQAEAAGHTNVVQRIRQDLERLDPDG